MLEGFLLLAYLPAALLPLPMPSYTLLRLFNLHFLTGRGTTFPYHSPHFPARHVPLSSCRRMEGMPPTHYFHPPAGPFPTVYEQDIPGLFPFLQDFALPSP